MKCFKRHQQIPLFQVAMTFQLSLTLLLALLVGGDAILTSSNGKGGSSKNDIHSHYWFPLGPGEEVGQWPTVSKTKSVDLRLIGCYDVWENNRREIFEEMEFQDFYTPETCSHDCLTREGRQVSMLRGAECVCSHVRDFGLRIHEGPYGCDVPCPVSSLQRQGQEASAPQTIGNCGGNWVYSVYCRTGDEDCNDIETTVHHDNDDTQNTIPDSPSFTNPTCGLCPFGSSCMAMIGQPVRPRYDYFPSNSAANCQRFCQTSIIYLKDGQWTVRPPYKYAVLLWAKVPKSMEIAPIPMCYCVDDIVAEGFLEVDMSECDTPCPGNKEQFCGQRGDIYTAMEYRATIYCTQPECAQPATVPTTTIPTTTTMTTTTASTTTVQSTSPKNCEGQRGNEAEADCPSDETETTPNDSSTSTPTTTEETTHPSTSTMRTSESPPVINCQLICEGTEHSGRHWSVCAGQIEEKDCGRDDAKGMAKWECSLDGDFTTDQPDYSQCHSPWIDDLLEESGKVNDTASAVDYLTRLNTNLTSDPSASTSAYFGHEISTFTTVLEKVMVRASEASGNFQDFEPVADITVDIMQTIVTTIEPWHQLSRESRSGISTQLLQALEDTSLNLTSKIHLDENGKNGENETGYERPLGLGTGSQKDLLVVAGAISKSASKNETLEFPSNPELHEDGILTLPSGWKTLIPGKSGDKVQYVGVYMDQQFANVLLPAQYPSLTIQDKSALPPQSTTNYHGKIINGKLISFTVATTEKSDNNKQGHFSIMSKDDVRRISLKFPEKGVQIVFNHELEAWGKSAKKIKRKLHSGEDPKAALGSGQCVFWDVKDLIWSTKGCKKISQSRSETICECNHLTSFALLMEIHQYTGKDLGLEILTLLLCSLSFISLFLSVLLFSVRGVQSERNSITKNLSACLLVGNTLVMLVLDRNYFNMSEGLCIASGILTHYIFLSAFAWMAIEGIHLYRMVVHVFDSENSPLNLYRVFAYGFPLIVVIITASVGFLKGDRPYGGDVVCWLDGSYIWSFLVPVLIVIVGNLIILFIALKTAYQVQQGSQKKQPAIQSRVRSFRTWLRGCLSLTILLGMTWLTGFFVLVPDTPGLLAAYLFTVLNASQGIFILIFHCIYNDKIRFMTYHRFGNYLPSWLSSSLYSGSSSGAYPSDGNGNGSRRGNSSMKHSPSGGSLSSGQGTPNLFPKPKIDIIDKGISIIAKSHPEKSPKVFHRKGSLVKKESFGFGTVSSMDSVFVERGGVGDIACAGINPIYGSFSDSGDSTDNSQHPLANR